MPSALALTSKFALGRQSAKGTPVTANLICGRYVQTSLQSIYEYIEAQNEHYCGPSARPTARKSFSRASGYTVPFGAQGFLYADSLPIMLIGAGFGCVSNTGGINEVTTLTTTGIPTGGTFTITYGAQTTAAIPYNDRHPSRSGPARAVHHRRERHHGYGKHRRRWQNLEY